MWFIAGWGRAVGGGRGVQVCPNPNSEEGNEGVRVAGWGVGGYIREERGQKGKIRWWWVCVRERRTECWRMMELQDTLGGLAVCKETSAAEEFGYVELRMNSEFWVSLTLSPSVTVTPMIMAVYPSCTLALIIFSSCISPLFCLSLPLLAALIGMNQFLKL